MSHLEKGLAALQENHARVSTVGHLHATVGIEVERGAVRQRHCGLLTDGRLNSGHLLLSVQAPRSAENECCHTCGHCDSCPPSSSCRRRCGCVHHLPKIDRPNQRAGFHELVPSHGKVCIGFRMQRMSADPGVKTSALVI